MSLCDAVVWSNFAELRFSLVEALITPAHDSTHSRVLIFSFNWLNLLIWDLVASSLPSLSVSFSFDVILFFFSLSSWISLVSSLIMLCLLSSGPFSSPWLNFSTCLSNFVAIFITLNYIPLNNTIYSIERTKKLLDNMMILYFPPFICIPFNLD